MKTIYFFAALTLALITYEAEAQLLNFGIKGGINYNANGDLRAIDFNTIEDISSSEEAGFHLGFLAEIKLPFFMYVRPELIYTHTESSYKADGNKSKFKMDKIEAPVLLGFRVLRVGRFFFGPSFQYIINSDLSTTENLEKVTELSSDDFTVSGQIGIGLNLGRFGADVRWETGFTDSEANFIGEITGNENPVALNVDTSHQQFIISFYYKFK